MPQHRFLVLGATFIVGVLVLTSLLYLDAQQQKNRAELKQISVPASVCQQCHPGAFAAWQNSHHALAMQTMAPSNTTADFNSQSQMRLGRTQRFFTSNASYFIETDGPDGETHPYLISAIIGVSPLQQFLTELTPGHFQVLPWAWDVQKKKWLHLQSNEFILPSDELHWTKQAYNWNSMCAECHTTAYQKNYVAATQKYQSTYREFRVSCESCHGPTASHVKWANTPALLRAPNHGFSKAYLHTNQTTLLETCATCHSRRSTLKEGFAPGKAFHEFYSLEVFDSEAYYPDGQFREEDFEATSFAQSKMFHKGVTCINCHEPHAGTLRQPGNALCLQCHEPKYEATTHHHHEVGTASSLCVSCHMPTKTYMSVHIRHDHRFYIPRPKLSESLGSPNACEKCHADRSPAWADESLLKWGAKRQREPHFGSVISALKNNPTQLRPELLVELAQLEKPVALASALLLLASSSDPTALSIQLSHLTNQNPMIREKSLASLLPRQDKNLLPLVAPLLLDKDLAVRLQAVRYFCQVLGTNAFAFGKPFSKALKEYEQCLQLGQDTFLGTRALAELKAIMGEPDQAISLYQKALLLVDEPETRLRLATLLATEQHFLDAENEFKKILFSSPKFPQALFSYGLFLAEAGRYTEAESSLRSAYSLAPTQSRLAYNYALILQNNHKTLEAEQVLEAAHELEPKDDDVRYALAVLTFNQQQFDRLKQLLQEVVEPSSRWELLKQQWLEAAKERN